MASALREFLGLVEVGREGPFIDEILAILTANDIAQCVCSMVGLVRIPCRVCLGRPQHLLQLKPADVVYDETTGRVSGGKKAFIALAIEQQRELVAEGRRQVDEAYPMPGAVDARVYRIEEAILSLSGKDKKDTKVALV